MPPQPPSNPVLDALDITPHPRPFKSPHWKPTTRRAKTLKQVLTDATRSQSATQNNSGTSTPLPPPATSQPAQPTQQALTATYANIESAPSLHPAHSKKWCDITGLPANYTDPKTRLRYADAEVYKAIRGLPPGAAERYLELRGANVVLK